MSQAIAEGWYADPQDRSPGAERWWNGHAWTAHTRVQPATTPSPQPTRSAPPPKATSLPDRTPLAQLAPRIVAYGIDVGLVFVVASVISGAIGVFGSLPGWYGWQGPSVWVLLGAPMKALLVIALWLGYQVACLTSDRPTLGKRLLRLQVRHVDGVGPIPVREALLRALVSGGGVLFVAFPGGQLLGLLLVGADAYQMQQDPLGRTWHDQLAETAVVSPAVP